MSGFTALFFLWQAFAISALINNFLIHWWTASLLAAETFAMFLCWTCQHRPGTTSSSQNSSVQPASGLKKKKISLCWAPLATKQQPPQRPASTAHVPAPAHAPARLERAWGKGSMQQGEARTVPGAPTASWGVEYFQLLPYFRWRCTFREGLIYKTAPYQQLRCSETQIQVNFDKHTHLQWGCWSKGAFSHATSSSFEQVTY